MKAFLIVILLLVFSSSLSQISFGNRTMSVDEMFDLMSHIKDQVKNFQVDSFNIYFEKNLNDYRLSQSIGVVCYEKEILSVATDQSSYCLKLGYLNHKQPTSVKEDTDDRCDFYGIDYTTTRENLIMCNMVNSLLIVYEKDMNFYDCLSQMILKCWKLSPGHNNALLDDDCQKFAVGISYSSNNDMVACFVLLGYQN